MSKAMPVDRSARIRQIFLERKRLYSLRDVVRLTGLPREEVLTSLAVGEYEASRSRGQYRFTWAELAHLAMVTWPLPVINDVLGVEAIRVLPRLILLHELRVHLPAYQVLMIHRLA